MLNNFIHDNVHLYGDKNVVEKRFFLLLFILIEHNLLIKKQTELSE